MQYYQAQPKFLVRTPLLALTGPLKLILSAATPEEQAQILYQTYQNKYVNDALFLASPTLHAQFEKRINGKPLPPAEEEQLVVSLTRYLLRMSTRCTPFGLFAGCTMGEWKGENIIRLDLPGQFIRHTRPDMDYLCQLAQTLAQLPGIKELIRYYPNSSHYVAGESIRFADYYYREKTRFHRLAAVERTDYLDRILLYAKNGAVLDDLVPLLTDDEVSREEALDYLYELIDGRLLISELDGNTTGPEMLDRMIAILRRLEYAPVPAEYACQLERLKTELEQIDEGLSIFDASKPYQTVLGILDQLEPSRDINRLLQADMYKPAAVCTLGASLLASIQQGIAVLNRLSPAISPSNLDKFKKAFVARYETKAIPLLEALDVERGIGYYNSSRSDINPLIDDLPVAAEEDKQMITLSKSRSFWLNKIVHAQKNDRYEIQLTDTELNSISETPAWDNLVESFSAMVSILQSPAEPNSLPLIYMNNAYGSSTRILGRFTHLHADIDQWVRNIAATENARYEDAVLAEIVHLPESRIGNILMRTHIRDYEIPYLAHSTAPVEKQVRLQDITVQIANNEIILYSTALQKEIIPVMSNAHNYSNKALPVYQFLCDLQHQNKRGGVHFSWGGLRSEFKFLPRVTYQNIVISRATWQVNMYDFKPLLDFKKEDDIVKGVLEWKNKLNMPDRVLVVRGDNELFVDFNNYLCVKSFLHEIKKSAALEIVEFLFDEQASLVTDEKGHAYANETIVVFTKEVAVHNRLKIKPEQPLFSAKRSFPIGSEWLYFKIYCGVKTADTILTQQIQSITRHLTRNCRIDQWFFIRYADPDQHIRLRLHLTGDRHLGDVISIVYQSLQPPLDQGLIWRILTDTYEREVERYGEETMEITEKLFCLDSVHTLQFLEKVDDFPEEFRWYYGLLAADSLLNCFELSIAQKKDFAEKMKNNFEAEFKVKENVQLRKQLNDKFRNHRKKVVPLLALIDQDTYGVLYDMVASRECDIRPVIKTIQKICKNGNIDAMDYLSSYVHMMFNRLFTSRQRLYELTLYALLYGYYQSAFYTTQNKPKPDVQPQLFHEQVA